MSTSQSGLIWYKADARMPLYTTGFVAAPAKALLLPITFDPGTQKPELVAKVIVPDVLLGAHHAPLQFAFYTGKQFPASYRGGMFLAEHGSWNRSIPVGARIMFTTLKSDGTADKTEVFADGWLDLLVTNCRAAALAFPWRAAASVGADGVAA